MLKKKIIVLGCLLSMSLLVACTEKTGESGNMAEYTQEKEQMAEYINLNSDLGIEFMQDLGDVQIEAAEPDGDASMCVYSDDKMVKGNAYNYPSADSSVRVYMIKMTQASNHHVLGIHVGDNSVDAKTILEREGFELTDLRKRSGLELFTYEKDGVQIDYSVSNKKSVVEEITVKMN